MSSARLAHDHRIVSLSLRGCCLRGGSASNIAAFIELHPRLRHIDLSNNNLSYEFGEMLLEALDRRDVARKEQEEQQKRSKSVASTSIRNSRNVPQQHVHLTRTASSLGGGPRQSADSKKPMLQDVYVNLEDTWFTWDSSCGRTVGPPSGNLWAAQKDCRTRLAPEGYDSLRDKLASHQIDYTHKVEVVQHHILLECPQSKPQLLRRSTARPEDQPKPKVLAIPKKGAKALLPVLQVHPIHE